MSSKEEHIVNKVAEYAHEGWMQAKLAQGVASRLSEDGEELMVPYSELSEKAKDLDRTAVRSVVTGILKLGYQII